MTPETLERQRRTADAHYYRPMSQIIADETPAAYRQPATVSPPLAPAPAPPLPPVGIRLPRPASAPPPTGSATPQPAGPERQRDRIHMPPVSINIRKPVGQYTDQLGRWVFSPIIAHYNRNRLNRPELADQRVPENKAIFHTWETDPTDSGADNTKYISKDGHFEVVKNPDGSIVRNPANVGTYNYFHQGLAFGIPHATADILPYLILGNSPMDPTTFWQRATRQLDYPISGKNQPDTETD